VPHASVLRVGVCVMPKSLKRYYGRGDLHFLTFSCYRRLPLLSTTRARNVFVEALGKIHERYKFSLIGYVVMPNHVHLLISESATATPSVVLKALKQRVSRDLRKSRCRAPAEQLHFASTEGDGNLPRFWQPRFYDFNVWSEKKIREKLEYMHANPIKKKLVDHPKDWPWSSWSFYTTGEAGLVRIDSFRG
jgi:putative transposase